MPYQKIITKDMRAAAKLGTELAQTHYAQTTDHDGMLPMMPTDADQQRLNELLGRAPTLDEQSELLNGYRESMLRLYGNANDQYRLNPVLVAEFWSLLGRYGHAVPLAGTPEHAEAELQLTRFLSDLGAGLDELHASARGDVSKSADSLATPD